MAFKTSLRLGLCQADHLHIVEDHFNKIGLLTDLKSLNGKKNIT
ncbi:MAG: hypothetical protein CM15mP73_5240 [Hyphomicrobiales bacterium]|nr:MAG: hypothetical protein CM15mP73_5240 [Hyphomicrobiales bacterium]